MAITTSYEDINPKSIKFAPKTDESVFWNARQKFNAEKMVETRKSIQKSGLLEDLLVRSLPDGNVQLVAGERRLRCILHLLENNEVCYNPLNGKEEKANKVFATLHCKVKHNCSDKEASKLSIAENLEREDVSDIDIMQYCIDLCNKKNADGSSMYSRLEVAEQLGRHQSWVSQTMTLTGLTSLAKEMLVDGALTRSTALALLKVKPEHVDKVLLQAQTLAKLADEKDKTRIASLVEKLEEKAEKAEFCVVATELSGGSESEKVAAKTVKSEVDKQLAEAISKKKTANSKQPRLSSELLQHATNSIKGARCGKANGLTHKTLRTILADLTDKLASEGPILHSSGNAIDRRDALILQKFLSLALGQTNAVNALDLLAEFYKEEGKEEWSTFEPVVLKIA